MLAGRERLDWFRRIVRPSSLRIRQIQRTHIWEDEKDATIGARVATDYLLKLS